MRSSWFLVASASVVLAAACGSDDGSSGPTPTGGSAGMSGAGASFGGLGGAAGSGGAFGGSAGQGAADASGGSAGQAGSAGAGGVAGSAGVGGSSGSGGLPPVVTPGAADRILLKGTVITPTGAINGEVLVEQTSITCVAASCAAQAGANGATIIETNGVIMPGMIDAHNHGLYNIFDESDWTPKQLYANHNQWNPTSEPRYGEVVDAKQYLEGVSTGANVSCEMDKYAEMKAIVGATTSFLLAGGAAERQCYGSLARTIDITYNDLPADKIQVSSLGVPDNAGAKAVCVKFADDSTDAYVVHVAEGIDTTAKNEFTTLQNRGVVGDPVGPPGCLIASQTTVVHGTALTATEFQVMAQANMGLVWSPRSNVFLYGATTNIPAAITAGVQKIALAPDWALGGSVNMLDELAFAANWDDTNWSNTLTSKRLVEMVTIDAARALAVQQYVGSLEVGKRADIAVVSPVAADAYDSVVQTRPNGVRLVMVDGRILYGDKAIQPAAPSVPGCEDLDVCGAPKVVCIAEDNTTNKLNQTLAQIKSALEAAVTAYDAAQTPAGGPLMPLAPLVKCP